MYLLSWTRLNFCLLTVDPDLNLASPKAGLRGLSRRRSQESSEQGNWKPWGGCARASARALCSVVSNSATPWTAGHRLLCLRFSRQEHWSRLHFLLQTAQGSNLRVLCLQHWRVGFLPLSCLGSPKVGKREFVKGDGSEKDFPGAQW